MQVLADADDNFNTTLHRIVVPARATRRAFEFRERVAAEVA